MDAFQEIESFEHELVNPKTRSNAERIAKLLADEFLEFGSSGKVIRKRDVLDAAEKLGTMTYQLDDFNFKMLGGIARISYISFCDVIASDRPPQLYLGQGIWKLENAAPSVNGSDKWS